MYSNPGSEKSAQSNATKAIPVAQPTELKPPVNWSPIITPTIKRNIRIPTIKKETFGKKFCRLANKKVFCKNNNPKTNATTMFKFLLLLPRMCVFWSTAKVKVNIKRNGRSMSKKP